MCPTQHNISDSEDDADYVPPTREQQDSDNSEDESQPHGQTGEATIANDESDTQQKEVVWASFQASLASPEENKRESTEAKMVKVQKRYLFAGEYTTEIVEVPEDSVDAKKWPHYQGSGDKSSSQDVVPIPEATVSSSTSSSVRPAEAQQKKLGPRKPKKVLAALPPSSSQKAKKLTTLDKSMMDWKAHTMSADLQVELDTNRKSGGYLEKVEFLQRVEERKEENLEAMKSRKRRKL
ncbi:hypothetical protein AGABI2DRAFT_74372 [Agaricus bisporus var. bisporus H97]|uniref:hypothetical protein n=1 Tax=Agaricus bisporus var. bisporus (strain H97 / ATCC MYA-4626 / FGSC 10389) TaxID=936046 RepID=UPI00029F6AB0|nr:hypothetical protein AGABI2DRAFT_74372 [Agaricus bisporus var. bisporus H97]EKV44647.1 hypothetical protein AGABI2DRAFT_74372 [Agaricus bisporus var. bisporus H97]